MKKLLILIVLVIAGIVAVGFQRGWFQMTSVVTEDNKTNVTVTVDKDKLHDDEAKAMQKVNAAKNKAVDAAETHLK